jgi:transcriptional regulator with XRE-family HTH domain
MSRKRLEDVCKERLKNPAARTGYERARRAFELAEQVRELREAQGLTQSELARRIGSTQPAIARLEAGGVAPSLASLECVAAALGLELVVGFQSPADGAPKGSRKARLSA